MTDDRSALGLRRPRSVGEIFGATLEAFRRAPLVLVVLAAVVVVPYELLVLLTTKAAPLAQQHARPSTAFVFLLLEFAFVGPLVSALHVHAVVRLGRGERPRLGDVAAHGVRVLAVVVAAQIVAGIGIGIGLIAFVIPGVILALRWAVVAQVAAVERTDWVGALGRSGHLVRGQYLHVLAVTIVVTVVNLGVTEAGVTIVGHSARLPDVALGIAVATLTRGFSALTSAILYFDLQARGAPMDVPAR